VRGYHRRQTRRFTAGDRRLTTADRWLTVADRLLTVADRRLTVADRWLTVAPRVSEGTRINTLERYRPVRIAQVAPLYESTPPRLYGGTERVVSYLTEELVRQGHQVTLFASGDSITAAELIAPCVRALRFNPDCRDPLAYHMIMLDEVFRRAEDFDIIHFHVDYLHLPISTRMRTAHLTTLHGRLDLPELSDVYRQFPEVPLVSGEYSCSGSP